MEPVEALARELPLGLVVDVHDVADVGDEDDALLGEMLDDPTRVVLKNGIGERRDALRRAFGRGALVTLRVGDDDDRERAGRRQVERRGARGGQQRNAG